MPERKVFPRPSVPTLHVNVGTRACNAKCNYCISKMNAEIVDKHLFNKNLDLAFSVASQSFLTNTVLVTGKGEPTLDFLDCMNVIGSARMKNFITEMQTNSFSLDEKKIEQLQNIGLNMLAISRVAFDDGENFKTMKMVGRLSLIQIIELFKKQGNVRLTFICMKGYNDTFKKIKETCRIANNLGVSQVTFRRMGMPNFVNSDEGAEVRNFVSENIIQKNLWNNMLKNIDEDYQCMRSYDWGSTSWMIEEVEALLAECLTDQGPNGTIRYLIYDGHLRISWEHKNALLF